MMQEMNNESKHMQSSKLSDEEQLCGVIGRMLQNGKIKMNQLGNFEVDLICSSIVSDYSNFRIKLSVNNKINTTVLYNDFLDWCNKKQICKELKTYFTQIMFSKYFGELFAQTRTSTGKFWKDIEFNKLSNSISDDYLGVHIGNIAHGETSDKIIRLQTNINYFKLFNKDTLCDKKICVGYYNDAFDGIDNNLVCVHKKIRGDINKPKTLIINGKMDDIKKIKSLDMCIINENEDGDEDEYFYNAQNINDKINIVCGDIITQGKIIASLPINFMLSFPTNKIIHNNNDDTYTYHIDISFMPFYFAFNKSFAPMTCFILIKEAEHINANIIYESYISNDRCVFSSETYHQLIPSFCEHKTKNIKKNVVVFDLSCDNNKSVVKGYFIHSNLIDEINNIALTYNHFNYFNYDKTMIDILCHRISHDVLYIPFNTDIKYNNYELSSFVTYVDVDRVELRELGITFNESKCDDNIVIYENAGFVM